MVKDLEVEECLEFLGKNYLGHLGYISGKTPFVTPITYFHDAENKCILSYSTKGHKMDAMRSYEHVSLQVEKIQTIRDWTSVQVHGTFEELTGSAAKKYLHKFAQGVQDIIERIKGEKPKFIGDFSSRLQEREMPIVYRININDIIGKIRKPKA